MVEFLADRQESGTVVRAGDDAVAAELAAKDLDLGHEETDAGVSAGSTCFSEEV